MYGDSRVLLVDDNDADNEFHEIMLRRAGFTGKTVVCDSAEAALETLSAQVSQPVRTLLLLDINMPRMDGFEFLAAAADLLSAHKSIVVVMLTSSAMDSDKLHAEDFPIIREYMVKPLLEKSARFLLQKYLA
jgi:CheY-like chemotaxis protein